MRAVDDPGKSPRRKVRQRAPGAGRKPKPTALHNLEGTTPHSDRSCEPKSPELQEVAAPKWLHELRDDGLAVEFFDRVARGLARLGVMTELDEHALAAVAETWSLYRRAVRSVPKRITTPGRGKKTPIVYQVRRQALRDLHMGLAQFGLSPVARTKVMAGEEVPLPPGLADQAEALDRGSEWLVLHGGSED